MVRGAHRGGGEQRLADPRPRSPGRRASARKRTGKHTVSLPYFAVDDVDAALQRVKELGGSVIHPAIPIARSARSRAWKRSSATGVLSARSMTRVRGIERSGARAPLPGGLIAVIRRRALGKQDRRRSAATFTPPSRSRRPPTRSCHALRKRAPFAGRARGDVGGVLMTPSPVMPIIRMNDGSGVLSALWRRDRSV